MAGSTLPEPVRAAYLAALETLPAGDRAARRADLDAFLERGFPPASVEEWRYTDLAALGQQGYAPAGVPARPDLASRHLPGTRQLTFLNGRFLPDASDPALPLVRHGAKPAIAAGLPRPDSIAHLNAALAAEGVTLRLPPGQSLDQPLHVLSLTVPGAKPDMSHLALAIELGDGASATVIFEDACTGDGAHLHTQRANVTLGAGARLDLVRLQEHGDGTQALCRWEATLARDAELDWTHVSLGGALVRNDLCADLAAANSRVSLAGLFLASGNGHLDNHTRIEHRSPHGTSRQVWRGMAADRARAVFNGKVVVHPGARRTDSDLQIANLLLSEQAQINAKPELQIDNDDVKCAHGATCGQLDENALYYLRQRGLPMDAARQVLLFAFANEILRPVGFAPARERMTRRLLARFPVALPETGLE